MGIPPGALNLDELNTRLEEAHVDSTLSTASRYRLLQDAYSRIWYKKPWEFRRAVASLSVAVDVQEYALDDQCDLVVAAFNKTNSNPLIMTEGFFRYWAEYSQYGNVGSPTKVADIRSDTGNTTLLFKETPTTSQGHGDIIEYYYYKHLTHMEAGGTVVTGNVAVSTDIPTFGPQFHALIIKEAVIEALKNKRQFGEAYGAAIRERNELLKDMSARYLTPRRYPGHTRTYR